MNNIHYTTSNIFSGTSSHQSITLHGEGLKINGMAGNHIVDIGINMEDISNEAVSALKTIVADSALEDDCNINESNIIIPIVQERKF